MAESEDRKKNEPQQAPQEPHLFDIGNLQEVAMWLAEAATTGVVGSTAYALINQVRRNLGGDGAAELEEKVFQLAKSVRGKGQLSNRDLRLRVRELFEKSKDS